MTHVFLVQLSIVGVYLLTSIAWVIVIVLLYKKLIKTGRLDRYIDRLEEWIIKKRG